MSADTIVNLGKEAWKIIEDNAPSADITATRTTASAMPQVSDWQNVTGARGPMWIRIPWQRMAAWPADNYIVAEFTVDLKWEYGATYQGGGAFIPNLWVEVPQLDVFWGQHISLEITVRNPTNANTPQAPRARIPVTISGMATNMLRDLGIQWSFILYGDGLWEQV